jgi:hypothetical protein
MEPISIVLIAALGLAVVLLAWRLYVVSSAAPALPASSAAAGKSGGDLDKKVADLQGELKAAREETQRKQKQLEEHREETKKKLARAGKKAAAEEEAKAGPDPRDTEIAGLKKGMAALESQLNTAKRELDRTTGDAERVRGESKNETEGALRAREDERNRNRSLADENLALKKTLDELRHAKRKENERPDVPGSALDLKALPAEAVQELARYFRKGEEFERLYHVSSGQLQLEKDRFQELQRRYFAVCRELALAAGQKPGNDQEAKAAAEGLVQGSDQVARTSGGGGGGGAPQVGGAAAAPGAPGEGKKRRRRRRKRKLPGQGELPGTDPATAAAGGADAGDDDGGDEGDEGGDDEGGDEQDSAEPTAAAAPTDGSTGPAPAPAG